MSEEEELIAPEQWTTKELVKHLYREMKAIRQEQEHIKGSLEVLEKDLERREIIQAEAEKRRKSQMAIVGVAGGLVGVFIEFVIRKISG